VVSDATAQDHVQPPIASLGALMTMPGDPAGALSAVRLLTRNLPLVLLPVMIGMLFWPTKEGERLQDEHEAQWSRRPHAEHFAVLMHQLPRERGVTHACTRGKIRHYPAFYNGCKIRPAGSGIRGVESSTT
jgi:hypothetical protein